MASVYYNRVLSDKMVNTIKEPKYFWIIDYVKEHPELDFQTGSNAKGTWFSVYRGTGRVLSISPNGTVSAAKAYMDLCPEFYSEPTLENFDKLLFEVSNNEVLGRYFINKKGVKKEGYYQGLISRRYSFENLDKNDCFIIFDKESVLGFTSKSEKAKWNTSIADEITELIAQIREILRSTKLPQDIKKEYGEIDFLGLTWNGDIVIMELKQDDSTKTYLSPVQIAFYNKQIKKLILELGEKLYHNIKELIKQKVDLGILNLRKELPKKLSGQILNYLVVGEDEELSPEICKRFKLIRDLTGIEIKAFTCEYDGTLKVSDKLD